MHTSTRANNPGRSGTRAVGSLGEEIAARFLRAKGYKITGRNVKTYLGEIDIVAERRGTIIFIEVKTRRSDGFGPPYNLITRKKKKKLIQCTFSYFGLKGTKDKPRQIDIISVELDNASGNVKQIEHFENAIEE